LSADLEELIDLKNRKRIIGWLKSGRDAMKKNLTDVYSEKNPSKYDLVVIGTPTWAGTITPAIRTYLTKNKFKKVAFFCTYGGNFGNVFSEMEKLSKKPVSVFGCKDKDVNRSEKEIVSFCDKLRKG
jgi:flavodoxin